MKIAIFGGAFNPVHNEHINVVKAAKKALSLDRVIIMPTAVSPHKMGRILASADDRLNMCRLAFGDMEGVDVSDYEIAQGGISYSYLTCAEFSRRHPRDELYFIVGADMLDYFPQWKNPRDILSCVKIAVCAREDRKKLNGVVSRFEKEFSVSPRVFNYVGGKVSSTRVRVLAALGEDFSEYVDEKVANYIAKNKLYRLEETSGVKQLLTPARWAHTVRVALAAAKNCSRFRISERSAVTAAALHDCAKYIPLSSPYLKGFVPPEGVPDPVMHQYTGAYVAENHFKVTDADIINAIRYHCSGRPNMTDSEKLLYLCDLLEEGRDFAGVEELRKLFAENIDKCLLAAFEHQLKYLESCGGEIYPLTEQATKFLKENQR